MAIQQSLFGRVHYCVFLLDQFMQLSPDLATFLRSTLSIGMSVVAASRIPLAYSPDIHLHPELPQLFCRPLLFFLRLSIQQGGAPQLVTLPLPGHSLRLSKVGWPPSSRPSQADGPALLASQRPELPPPDLQPGAPTHRAVSPDWHFCGDAPH